MRRTWSNTTADHLLYPECIGTAEDAAYIQTAPDIIENDDYRPFLRPVIIIRRYSAEFIHGLLFRHPAKITRPTSCLAGDIAHCNRGLNPSREPISFSTCKAFGIEHMS